MAIHKAQSTAPYVKMGARTKILRKGVYFCVWISEKLRISHS